MLGFFLGGGQDLMHTWGLEHAHLEIVLLWNEFW